MKYLLALGLACLIFPSFGGFVLHEATNATDKFVTGKNADQLAHWADQQGQKAVASSKPDGQVVPTTTDSSAPANAGGTSTVASPAAGASVGQTASRQQTALPARRSAPRLARQAGTVSAVVGGDTLRLSDGSLVKLAQVEAPAPSQCYGRRAARALAGLARPGDHVLLAADPALPSKDRHGRLLRYVWDGSIFLNTRTLVVGSTAPRFEQELRGGYADRFERYGRQARAAQVGLWGDCHAAYDPYRDVTTGPTGR